MLKAGRDEGEETPEAHENLSALVLDAETAPDRKTDQNVAEDAARYKRHKTGRHLGKGALRNGFRDRTGLETACIEEQGEQHGTRDIAEPADTPELQELGCAYLAIEDTGRHDHGVAGKEFRAGNDHEAQCDTEGSTHHNLGRRVPGQKAAFRENQKNAEADISACQHGHEKIPEGVFLQ